MKLNEFAKLFDKELRKHLSGIEIYEPLKESVSYTPLLGGKRLRPYLLYELAQNTLFGSERALLTGIAVELFHSGSLIHDDLPSIDNDDLRRGKPSCHIKFGEGRAILAGDFLMLYPARLLYSIELPCISKQKLLEMWSISALRVVQGEYADVTPSESTEEFLDFIYDNKTSALFGFCFAAPYILDTDSSRENMYELGMEFGRIFQMLDDIKDATSTMEELGKTPGKDLKQHKLSILSFLSIEEALVVAKRRFEDLTDRIAVHESLVHELQGMYEILIRR